MQQICVVEAILMEFARRTRSWTLNPPRRNHLSRYSWSRPTPGARWLPSYALHLWLIWRLFSILQETEDSSTRNSPSCARYQSPPRLWLFHSQCCLRTPYCQDPLTNFTSNTVVATRVLNTDWWFGIEDLKLFHDHVMQFWRINVPAGWVGNSKGCLMCSYD